MTAWLKIAFRNLRKNRRRSLATIVALALGFAAVNVFAGFTRYVHHGNRDVAIYALCRGHLSVFKKGFWEEGRLQPTRFLMNRAELEAVQAIGRSLPAVVLATPQLRITGLVSNGKVSTIFLAQALVPSAVDIFLERTRLKRMIHFMGQPLQDDIPYGIAVANGLARLLDLQLGSQAVVMSTTVDGQMNALDMEVLQLFDSNSEELNDKVMRVPLEFARDLYDTPGADRMAILLADTSKTAATQRKLAAAIERKGLDLEIKTWEELSDWYQQVKEMFDVIFMFLFTIVFIIVVMSVLNTMGMAVYERTREIGTLRALGLKRRGVLLLFALESSMLGFIGTLGGILISLLAWGGVVFLKPTWIPPGLAQRVPLQIELSPALMAVSFICLTGLCLLASLLPARQASHRNVVEALGHV